MDDEGAKLHQQNLDPCSSDSQEADSPLANITENTGSGNRNTTTVDNAFTTNSPGLEADVSNSSTSRDTDDRNTAEGNSDEPENLQEPPQPQNDLDDDNLPPAHLIMASVNEGYSFPTQITVHGFGANSSSDDQQMSGIDDEMTMSSVLALLECDSDSSPSFNLDPPSSGSQQGNTSSADIPTNTDYENPEATSSSAENANSSGMEANTDDLPESELDLSDIEDPSIAEGDSDEPEYIEEPEPPPDESDDTPSPAEDRVSDYAGYTGESDTDGAEVQEVLSRKRNIHLGPLNALRDGSSSSEVSNQNSPARRPFFRSVKRTRAAPKSQSQVASSSEPQPSTSRGLDQRPNLSEASSARAQHESTNLSEASTSSTRVRHQSANLSEASSSFSRMRIRTEPADPFHSSSDSFIIPNADILFPSLIADLATRQGHPAASSIPTSSFARTGAAFLSIPTSSSAGIRGSAGSSIPTGSFGRTHGHAGGLPRRRTFGGTRTDPVDLLFSPSSFTRVRGQPEDLLFPTYAFGDAPGLPQDFLVLSTSPPRIPTSRGIVSFTDSVIRETMEYGRRELGLVLARVLHIPTIPIPSPPRQTREALTNLMWDAMASGDGATALYALNNGADPFYCRGQDWTPLHASIVTGDLDFSNALVQKGAQVNRRSFPEGYTPLHLAALWDRTNLAVLLLQNGARAAKKDAKGNKAMVYAVKWKHERMVAILNAANVPDDSEDTEESEENDTSDSL